MECKREDELEWKIDPRHYIFNEDFDPRDLPLYIKCPCDWQMNHIIMGGNPRYHNCSPPKNAPSDCSNIVRSISEDMKQGEITWMTFEEMIKVYNKSSVFDIYTISQENKNHFQSFQSLKSFKEFEIWDFADWIVYVEWLTIYGPVNPWKSQSEIACAELLTLLKKICHQY